jgi:DNA-binding transcriptional LysR family regulator
VDRFDAMRLFTRIVERRSFTSAAQDLGIPRSTVTEAIKQLEARLSTRLLQRTTRQVCPTLDGEAYYRRCLRLIADLEEAESAFVDARPSGLLRVDVHGTLGRHFILPGLPAFLERHPDLRIQLSEGERLVDLVREGVDCVLRAGEPADSSMVARRVALLPEATCAAPSYLERFGTPGTPDALEGHRMIGFVHPVTGDHFPLEFTAGGTKRHFALPARVSVANAETNVAAALLGLGVIQVPRYHVERHLADGSLVEILADFPPTPTPVSLLYPHAGHLPLRTRAFIDWAAGEFASRLGSLPAARPRPIPAAGSPP